MRATGTAGLLLVAALATACSPSPQPAIEGAADEAASARTTPPLAPPQAAAREGRTKSLAADSSEIRYRVYGTGEPAIVFVHGWSCDSGYWDAQLNALAAKYTVITVDLAGHGASPGKRRKDWSMGNFGADVAGAVKDAGVGRVVLVGSSMGGTVALEAARQLPGQVIGIVGVDTFRDIAAPYPKQTVDGLLASLRTDFAKGASDFVGRNFFTERTDPVLKRWIVEDMAEAPPAVAIPALEALVAMDYRPVLAELDLPVIALNSPGSPTDEGATRLIEPRFRVVTLPGVGHFPMLEDPATFNAALERIVAEWWWLEAVRNSLSDEAPTR